MFGKNKKIKLQEEDEDIIQSDCFWFIGHSDFQESIETTKSILENNRKDVINKPYDYS